MPKFLKVPTPGRRYSFINVEFIELIEPTFVVDPSIGSMREGNECYLHFAGADGRMRIEQSASLTLQQISALT